MPTPVADVAHLLRRSGFGATTAEIADLAALDRAELIEVVLSDAAAPPDVPPASLGDPAVGSYQQWEHLTQWWLDRMATSPTPLVEKLTLFWHGHFVSAKSKVPSMSALYDQNARYRAGALGDVHALTSAMAVEPAMLYYLDNWRNRAGSPNENFARELMELFTIGVGNYTEDDVKASAAAWTGHGLDDTKTTYAFRPSWHDPGSKTFMGLTRAWDGPEIIDHLLTGATTRTLAARFLATKLWLFLAGPPPSPATLDALAAAFVARLDVTDLLRALFSHPDFWSPPVRQGLVRSPVEFVVAIMRATGLDGATANPQWWLEGMGQKPFDPPNVSGWRTNGYWISTSATSARAGFARHATWKARQRGVLEDTLGAPPAEAVQMAFDLFALDRVTDRTRATLEAWVVAQRNARQSWAVAPNLLTLVPLTPEFQLA